MKRPYLSALLIGALTVASVGSLTSCKEYDGDISDLKEQVDKAALKTDLETLQATVRNVQTADSIAAANAKKAIETLNAHDLTQMENSIKDNAQKVADAIESTNTQIQNLKKENEKAVEEAAAKINESLKAQMEKWGGALDNYYTAKQINEKLDALAEAVNKATDEQLADLKKTVESYKTNINALYSAVTSVSLYINSEESTETAWKLTFPSGKVAQDYDFGKKEVNKDTIFTATPIVSYKKDTPINLPTKLTVRVNPVNAALTTDMIKLVDSEGNTLDDIIQVKSVEKRSGLLLKTKASQGTGLWDVYFQVKDGVDASKAERKSGSNYIAYAFAVNNTASKVDTTAISSADAASRYVVSAYDLTLRGAGEYSKASSLGDITVAAESEPETKKKLSELTPQASGTTLGVQNGENILLDLSTLKNKAEKFYVAVDYSGVVYDSNMSEYNAWKSYQYTNMNKVYDVSEANPTISVTINGQADDEVQFRIFAVNYDGTLVENTGKAFRVKVGAVTNIATVEGDLKAAITSSTTTGSTYTTSMVTGWLPISQTLMKGAQLPTTLKFTGNDGNSITASVSYAEDADGKTTFTPSADNTDNTKVKYVKFTIPASNASTSNLQYWPDGGTLTAYIKDTASPTINKIKVTLKKVMPTAEDAKKLMSYEWKGGYLVNGTYTAYLAPCSQTSNYQAAWTSDLSTNTNAVGYTDMSSVINMDKSVANTFASISVENAAYNDTDKKYTDALSVGSSTKWAMPVPLYTSNVASNLIDNKTVHKSSVIYNFGAISSEKKNGNFINYEVVVDTYNTIFACPLDDSVQKFAWEQAIKSQATTTAAAEMMDVNVITFGTNYSDAKVTAYADSKAASESQISFLKYIKATNSANSNFSLSLYDLLYSSGGSQKYLSNNITAHLYTKGTKNEDFFTVSISGGSSPSITFTATSSTTQPTYNIESTLEINLKDAFGHTHTYEVPMLVKTK